jgi:hypothetical protein
MKGGDSENPATYEEVGGEIDEFVTKRFFEKELKFLITGYY